MKKPEIATTISRLEFVGSINTDDDMFYSNI